MKSDKGLTLLELIVVLALIAILVGIVHPKLDSVFSESVLNARAREILHDLQRTQQAGISRGESHRFEINTSSMVYRIRPQNPFKPSLKIVNLTAPIVSVSSNFADIGGGWRGITYTPTGIPSQTGEIVIFDKRGRGRAIVVAVGTGRARIEVRSR